MTKGLGTNSIFWVQLNTQKKYVVYNYSLRSKRSRASERNSGHEEQKSGRKGLGGGKRRERLPANPLILKNAH